MPERDQGPTTVGLPPDQELVDPDPEAHEADYPRVGRRMPEPDDVLELADPREVARLVQQLEHALHSASRQLRALVAAVYGQGPQQHAAESLKDRVLAQIQMTPTHWIWTGGLNNGRPSVSLPGGGREYVHRFLWRSDGRLLAKGEHLVNTCGVQLCVLLEHHAPEKLGRRDPDDARGREYLSDVARDALAMGALPRSAGRPRGDYCKRGHVIQTYPSGRRGCKECDKIRHRAGGRSKRDAELHGMGRLLEREREQAELRAEHAFDALDDEALGRPAAPQVPALGSSARPGATLEDILAELGLPTEPPPARGADGDPDTDPLTGSPSGPSLPSDTPPGSTPTNAPFFTPLDFGTFFAPSRHARPPQAPPGAAYARRATTPDPQQPPTTPSHSGHDHAGPDGRDNSQYDGTDTQPVAEKPSHPDHTSTTQHSSIPRGRAVLAPPAIVPGEVLDDPARRAALAEASIRADRSRLIRRKQAARLPDGQAGGPAPTPDRGHGED